MPFLALAASWRYNPPYGCPDISPHPIGATIAFHYIYPPLSIGLGVLLVIMEGLWLKTNKPVYHQMARFWTKVFALTFAIGVATGIVMEFEFGTNWAAYSRFVGDVFGSALAAEGIFAFFLESGFLPCCCLAGTGEPQGAFFLHMHGLPGRAFQRHLDHRRQFLDADAGGLSQSDAQWCLARGSYRFWEVVSIHPCSSGFPHGLRGVVRGGVSRRQRQRMVFAQRKHLEFPAHR